MTRRDEIFEILCDYAKQHLGNSPSIYDLEREMKKRGYKISHGTIRIHLTKLMLEQRVTRVDGKLIIINSNWLRPGEIKEQVFSD